MVICYSHKQLLSTNRPTSLSDLLTQTQFHLWEFEHTAAYDLWPAKDTGYTCVGDPSRRLDALIADGRASDPARTQLQSVSSCSLSTTFSPVMIAVTASTAPVVEYAQQLPHCSIRKRNRINPFPNRHSTISTHQVSLVRVR